MSKSSKKNEFYIEGTNGPFQKNCHNFFILRYHNIPHTTFNRGDSSLKNGILMIKYMVILVICLCAMWQQKIKKLMKIVI